jgi:hypothetical protein
MMLVRKLLLATGLAAGLLIPGAAQAQFSMRGKICPWGLQIIHQQQQQQMMWQYKQHQQQTQLAMQLRQKQQYQHIQKTIPGPRRQASSPLYVRNSPPQVVKHPVFQPLIRRQVTQQMVRRTVVEPRLMVHEQQKVIPLHLHWIYRPEGPGDFDTLLRAELLALLRLKWQSLKLHTAVHTMHQIRTKHETKSTAVPRHRHEVTHKPPVVHHPLHVKHAAPPQHQHHTKAKTVAELQVTLKVHKKTTADSGIVKKNTSITILDIRCARCHQKMHSLPNQPHLLAIPKAHPPMPKPLAKTSAPVNNPIAKGPVPFKNPLAKEPVVLKKPLAKESPPVAKQPMPFPQPKPLPLAITKVQPLPALTLAFPASKTVVPPLAPNSKPANLNEPWRSGPNSLPIGPMIPGPNPFSGTGPGLLLPAMLANASNTPISKPAGTTPLAGLPGESPFDLPAGMPKQATDRSETEEQFFAESIRKDLLQPDFPPPPPSVLLLRPRVIPRNQESPDYSPLRGRPLLAREKLGRP